MSPEKEEGPTKEGGESVVESSADWLLESLVVTANSNYDFYVTVTLTVKGAIVSGLLVGGKKFLEEYGATIAKANKDVEEARKIVTHFNTVGAEVYDPLKIQQATNLPNFIHLIKAVIMCGPTRLLVGLWRGKMSEVDSFSLGAANFEE